MRHWKRLFYYLMINVLVSACTVLAVLSFWERTHPFSIEATPTLTEAASAIIPPLNPGTPLDTPDIAEVTLATATPVRPSEIQSEATAAGGREYIVQLGDTLMSIAQRFDVAMEAIIEANGLVNPDRLDVGQVLIIPDQGNEPPTSPTLPPAEPTDTPAPSPNPTSTPQGEPRVVIVSAFGVGDLDSERIRLMLTGGGEVSLSGWVIEDEDENTYTFPQLILFAGGSIDLYTKAGQAAARELYWGLNRAVWSQGERVTLRDANGRVHATYLIP